MLTGAAGTSTPAVADTTHDQAVHRQSIVSPGKTGDGKTEEEAARTQTLHTTAQVQIQRSTKWNAAGTVHETVNLADQVLGGADPITWEMLNGSMLTSHAVAQAAIKQPTITTTGTGSSWKARVDAVPEQAGSFDETVLAPGPWSTTTTKAIVGAQYGLASCSGGAGNTTFSATGKPSDNVVYRANRRHEDHHAADHKRAFDATIGTWDKKLEEVKTKGTEFGGTSAAAATSALWAAVGGTPEKIATDFNDLCGSKGTAYHGTPAGGPMGVSNPVANASCSTSSVEVTNPS